MLILLARVEKPRKDFKELVAHVSFGARTAEMGWKNEGEGGMVVWGLLQAEFLMRVVIWADGFGFYRDL